MPRNRIATYKFSEAEKMIIKESDQLEGLLAREGCSQQHIARFLQEAKANDGTLRAFQHRAYMASATGAKGMDAIGEMMLPDNNNATKLCGKALTAVVIAPQVAYLQHRYTVEVCLDGSRIQAWLVEAGTETLWVSTASRVAAPAVIFPEDDA